jgi:beta-lactam-binding protein with PASTA domain
MPGEPPKMPRLHHLTLEQAQHTLQTENRPFRIQRVASRAVPKGELIAVSQWPGTSAEDPREVVLTVSSGPPTTTA